VFCDPKRESRRTITISGDEETPDGIRLASNAIDRKLLTELRQANSSGRA